MWRCTKCGIGNSGTNKPLVGTCIKGGGHRWTAADVGVSRWQCGKCGTVRSSNGRPNDARCIKGGNCTWRKYN